MRERTRMRLKTLPSTSKSKSSVLGTPANSELRCGGEYSEFLLSVKEHEERKKETREMMMIMNVA